MFDIGLGEIVLVLFASLFIFGPDRLPQVAAQAARFLRQIREMAAGARSDLTDALGPEFGDLGLGEFKDLANLGDLRSMDPRKAITNAILGGADDAGKPAVTQATQTTQPATQPATQPEASTPPVAQPSVFDADAT